MYSMKETSKKTGLSYGTLKFYCNEGLIPGVKRDQNNYRVFDEKTIAWIESLYCLRGCGMSIQEMKEYLAFCLAGEPTIPERKKMLDIKRRELLEQIDELKSYVSFIDEKQNFYDDVLSGKIEYKSNLIS